MLKRNQLLEQLYEEKRHSPEPGRWAVGKCADSPRSYIVHLQKPYFFAEYEVADEPPTLDHAKSRYELAGYRLCDIRWQTEEESMLMRAVLCIEAIAAIKRASMNRPGDE
jgi:hypothetical protein